MPAFVGYVNISDSDDEMPQVIRCNSTDRDSKEVKSGKEELPQTIEDKLKCKQESLNCTNAEDTLKRKEASSLTPNPVFFKQFKGGTNAEDTYGIFNCDDSSSGSESEGSEDLNLDLFLSKLRCNQRGDASRY